jgi:hypothetical protein
MILLLLISLSSQTTSQTINALISNKHHMNLVFEYCKLTGIIISPISQIIYPNKSQQLNIISIDDIKFISGKCSYNMVMRNIIYDVMDFYFYNNIIFDLEYYGMSANYQYKNFTDNYSSGYVDYYLWI